MAKKAGVGVSFRRRFSEVEKEAIREAAAAGADHEGLAKEYNTTLNTINNLVSGKTAAKKKGKRRGRPPAAEAEAGAPAKRRGRKPKSASVDPSAEDALRLFSSLSALKQQRDELNKQIEALEDQFKKALSKSKALQEYITIP